MRIDLGGGGGEREREREREGGRERNYQSLLINASSFFLSIRMVFVCIISGLVLAPPCVFSKSSREFVSDRTDNWISKFLCVVSYIIEKLQSSL